MTRVSQFASKSRFPGCALCNEPVDLRAAKTDEDGHAVHEECYLLRMQMKGSIPPPTENPSSGSSQ